MSYYYKKYLKGSSDDEYRRRCDNEWHKHHCNKRCDDDCERPDFDDEPAFGTVTGTFTTAAATTTTLPLTTLISPSRNVNVALNGGLTVLKSGEYFISFTATSTPTLATTTVTYTINAGGFTQTITATTGTVTGALVRYLRRGDTVTVTATTTGATTINAALTVAKVSSRFSEKDFY